MSVSWQALDRFAKHLLFHSKSNIFLLALSTTVVSSDARYISQNRGVKYTSVVLCHFDILPLLRSAGKQKIPISFGKSGFYYLLLFF